METTGYTSDDSTRAQALGNETSDCAECEGNRLIERHDGRWRQCPKCRPRVDDKPQPVIGRTHYVHDG